MWDIYSGKFYSKVTCNYMQSYCVQISPHSSEQIVYIVTEYIRSNATYAQALVHVNPLKVCCYEFDNREKDCVNKE